MLTPLLIGCAVVVFTMGIQVVAVVFTLRYLLRLVSRRPLVNQGFAFDTYVIGVVLMVLFVGHLFQVGVWAGLFMFLGEFDDFATAFYHSLVNFASLGYGDIVMSEKWRLLGALESSIGVLMFGLTAGIMIAVMTPLFSRHSPADKQLQKIYKNQP